MIKDIKSLKIRGHILIDLLVNTGLSKSVIYRKLEKKLGHDRHYAHFGNCIDAYQIENNIKILKAMLQSREQRQLNKKHGNNVKVAKIKPESLSLAEQREIHKTFTNKNKTVWKRLKMILRLPNNLFVKTTEDTIIL